MEDKKVRNSARKYSEYDYMFTAAKIASLSLGIARAEKLDALADASGFEEAAERLGELGVGVIKGEDGVDVEATLTGFTADKYRELERFVPHSELVDICRLRYDCHNVKVAVKCRALGAQAEKFVIDCGTVPAAQVIAAAEKYEKGSFAFLPRNMAQAADEAVNALDATGSARVVDVLLDRACFADMREYADAVGFAPVCELVSVKADYTNILTALRIGRMKNADAAAELLRDSLVPGGKIPTDRLRLAADAAAVAALADAAGYAALADAVRTSPAGAAGLETVAAAADNAFIAQVKEMTHFRQLGAYPLVDYVISLEYEIKNLRIILSGKRTGADAQTIRERLRRG